MQRPNLAELSWNKDKLHNDDDNDYSMSGYQAMRN